ncbi:hypothetical protein STEG23_004902, partial [Scotinomys teguina]
IKFDQHNLLKMLSFPVYNFGFFLKNQGSLMPKGSLESTFLHQRCSHMEIKALRRHQIDYYMFSELCRCFNNGALP